MDKTITALVIVGTGGFFGSILRYLLASWANSRFIETTNLNFPFGTLFVNFCGSLLLAVFIAWAGQHLHVSEQTRLLIATGFFGGFTTFSTFTNESLALLYQGAWGTGILNIILSNALCLTGAGIGMLLGSRL